MYLCIYAYLFSYHVNLLSTKNQKKKGEEKSNRNSPRLISSMTLILGNITMEKKNGTNVSIVFKNSPPP